MKAPILAAAAALLMALFSTACTAGNGLLTSLEDLNTETEAQGSCKLPQNRVISVPGLLPFPEVGFVDFYKRDRRPSAAIGLNVEKSYRLVSTIYPQTGPAGDQSACDEQCLFNVRGEIVKLQTMAQAKIAARFESLSNEEKAQQQSPIEPSAPVSAVGQPPQPPAPDDKPLTTDSQAEAGSGDSGEKSSEEAVNSTPATVTDAEITTPPSPSDTHDARSAYDKQYEKVVNLLNKTGVMVYRWESASSLQGGGAFAPLFSAGGKSQEHYFGFALVSGLRMSTLILGKDFASAKQFSQESRMSNRFEMTTHVMQARYIAYVSALDLEKYVQARFEASKDQLSGLASGRIDLEKAQLELVAASVSGLSNMGVMGDIERDLKEINWDTHLSTTTIKEINGWHTFFAVKAHVGNLLEVAKDEHASWIKLWGRDALKFVCLTR